MNPIAVLFAMIAVAVMTPMLATAMHRDTAIVIDAVTARQLHSVSAAAAAFITAHAANLQAELAQLPSLNLCLPTAAQPCADPTLDLSTGYLPPSFNPQNPFQQTWSVVVTLNGGFLQALVLSSGGQAIPAVDAASIAAQAGANAGVIGGGSGAQSVPDCAAGQACGVLGGWGPLALGDGSAYPDPGAGHLAALLSFSMAGVLQSTELARVNVPGHPELNTLQTDLSLLDAGGVAHNIVGAAQVGASTLSAANSVALGTAAAASPHGVCTPNGLMAANQDGSGQILACQFGVWQPVGGNAQPVAHFTVQDWRLSHANNPVPIPVCPNGGSAAITVTPQNFSVNASAVVSFGTTGNGPWSVYIQDGSGNPLPGATALASTYCAY